MYKFTEYNITAFTSLDVPSLVAYFEEEDEALGEVFTEAAKILQTSEDLVFGKTSILPSQLCKFQRIKKMFIFCYFDYVIRSTRMS